MGGASQATKDQQKVTLQASQQQLAFNMQLTDLFQKQYADQKSTLDFLKSTVKPIVARSQTGKGFDPATEAAMRTSATDTLSQQFQNARAALNQTLKTSGDANVPSGVTVGADTALFNQEAIAKAGAQRDITVQSASLANSNLWNSLNALNGVAAQANPLGYSSERTSGSGAVAALGTSQGNLQNAITTANSNSFLGKLSSGIGTAIGNIPFAFA